MEELGRWRGKVVVITGASAGIGAAIAEALAAAGLKIVIAARDGARLESLKARLASAGGQVLSVPTDLRSEKEIAQLFATVREHWRGADVLINNAGLGYVGKLAQQDPADWGNMLQVNVLALSLCTQLALQDMRGRPEAQIINISSIAGHRVPPGTNTAYYSATKHAVRAFTDALRMELVAEKSPIRVGMISPGVVETEFHQRATRSPGSHGYGAFPVLKASDVSAAVCYMLGTPPHVAIHDIIMRSTAQPN